MTYGIWIVPIFPTTPGVSQVTLVLSPGSAFDLLRLVL